MNNQRTERVKSLLNKTGTEFDSVEIKKDVGCKINVNAKLKRESKQRFDLSRIWSWSEKDLHLTSFSLSSNETLRLGFICDNLGCIYCEGE